MPRHLAIFGAGRSGRAALKLAEARGDATELFDEAASGACGAFARKDLDRFDGFVFSPGFSADHPWRLLAGETRRPVCSELAFAAAYWKGPILGVTGTNGKTTLTQLLAEALGAASQPALACGNIGRPMSEAVLDRRNEPGATAVAEISSFQAELSQGLRLDALFWTSFAEDHLDRYRSMEDYFAAKVVLLRCRKPGAPAIFGPQLEPRLVDAGCLDSSCHFAAGAELLAARLPPGAPLRLNPHRNNLDLAVTYWKLMGHPFSALRTAATSFRLAGHRLQRVSEKEGVSYWNDAKATNFQAALAAVAALPRPIVWIGGGRAKGGAIDAFAREIAGQIDVAVLYGEVAPALASALASSPVESITEPVFSSAVQAAAERARALGGAQVVLSPGFASFDQFASYEERGKSFISIVLGL